MSNTSTTSSSIPATWPDGHQLDNKYRILKRIGTTTKCEIYLAEETIYPESMEHVAIKLLLPKYSNENFILFQREDKILSRLRHKNVLGSLDRMKSETGFSDRYYFIVEFANEGNLQQYLKNRKLDTITAVELAIALCDALAHVHGEGVIHRDIKPENILIFEKSGELVPKLADFNIAHAPQKWKVGSATTISGSFMGTYQYASPEQITNGGFDEGSDIFSWALVFYYILTGENPVGVIKDPTNFLPKYDALPIKLFTDKGIPENLALVLQECLHNDPLKRQKSAKELLNKLQRVLTSFGPKIGEIEQALKIGWETIKENKWSEAIESFNRGLQLTYGNYYSTKEQKEKITTLTKQMEDGVLYATALDDFVGYEWQKALDKLRQIKDGQHIGASSLIEIAQAATEKKWQKVYNLMTIKSIVLDDLTREKIRDLALYFQAEAFYEGEDWKNAYTWFCEGLNTSGPKPDMRSRAANAAYKQSKVEKTLFNTEARIEWLQKTLKLDNYHLDGGVKSELYEVQYDYALELMSKDKLKAFHNLEAVLKIMPPNHSSYEYARNKLAEIYLFFGEQAYLNNDWRGALIQWDRLEEIGRKKKRPFYKYHVAILGSKFNPHPIVVVTAAILIPVLAIVAPLLASQNGISTPAATLSTTSTFTATATFTPEPTSTPTPVIRPSLTVTSLPEPSPILTTPSLIPNTGKLPITGLDLKQLGTLVSTNASVPQDIPPQSTSITQDENNGGRPTSSTLTSTPTPTLMSTSTATSTNTPVP